MGSIFMGMMQECGANILSNWAWLVENKMYMIKCDPPRMIPRMRDCDMISFI